MKIKKLKWIVDTDGDFRATAPAIGKYYQIFPENGFYYAVWFNGNHIPGSKDLDFIKAKAQEDFESIINQAFELE